MINTQDYLRMVDTYQKEIYKSWDKIKSLEKNLRVTKKELSDLIKRSVKVAKEARTADKDLQKKRLKIQELRKEINGLKTIIDESNRQSPAPPKPKEEIKMSDYVVNDEDEMPEYLAKLKKYGFYAGWCRPGDHPGPKNKYLLFIGAEISLAKPYAEKLRLKAKSAVNNENTNYSHFEFYLNEYWEIEKLYSEIANEYLAWIEREKLIKNG